MILSNSQAGLIDLDLVKNQKVQKAYSSFRGMNDYGTFELIGYPRKGQKTLRRYFKIVFARS